MRKRVYQTLLLAFALTFATPAQAQIFNSPPTINSVTTKNSFEAGTITIRGKDLSLVTKVTLDTLVLDIASQTDKRIVADVPVLAPGTTTVTVKNPFGTDSAETALTPALEGARRGMRGRFELQNGTVGAYMLLFSYDTRSAVTTPGVFNPLFLNLNSPDSGLLASGLFTSPDLLFVFVNPLPFDISLTGLSMSVQALCEQGAPATSMAYTNLLTLEVFPPQVTDQSLIPGPLPDRTKPGS